MGGIVYTPISSDTFVNGDSRLVVDGGRLRENGMLLEKVERVTPGAAELQAYAGDYSSDDARATLRFAVQGERLMMQNRPGAWLPLVPTYRDAFNSNIGVVRFLRDASSKVVEMSVTQDRVWDLRFRKR
jgi:hypothetical protein